MGSPPVKAYVVINRPRDGALLVGSADADDFERPLGGHVEIGELAVDAARRELREEIGQEIVDVEPLGVLENRFVLDGQQGHEVAFVFRAAFADPAAYAIEDQPLLDDPTGLVRVRWRRPGDSQRRLVPAGLDDLIGDGRVVRDAGPEQAR